MALPLDIDDLIRQRKVEGARIEYKRGWNPEKVLHSLCVFANNIASIRSECYRKRTIAIC